jgi:UDP-2,3-diacylglucosamine pyrophosphatase LpxH
MAIILAPMLPVPAFDHVSVISDLHIGGAEGFQIFGQGALLSAFIDHLRQDSPPESALVINGDMVDFLAEPAARAFDPEGAIGKLDRIFTDKNFTPVWDALRKYVRTRQLVITLGNHDIELALPWVRRHLLGLLTGGDAAAQSRITLAFDGSGFACTVGTSSVLCLHGNEVDTWNVTDYETVRRIACDLAQGRHVSDWVPNAGTKLVVEVMNEIKRRYAFIDLLKPEKEAAVRVLLVLEPDQRAKLRAVAEIASRRVWDGVRRAVGWLSADDGDGDHPAAPDALARIVGKVETKVDPTKLMDHAESLFRTTNPVDLVYGQQDQQLGWWDALTAVMSRREPHEIAREAIKEVADHTTFDVGHIDADYRLIDELAGPACDIVVAGHTHLARSLNRARGRGRYFNSGTWASLMQLTPAQLNTAAAFEPVFETMRQAKTIADLKGLVCTRPTVVTVRKQGNQVDASLDKVTRIGKKIVLAPMRPAKS